MTTKADLRQLSRIYAARDWSALRAFLERKTPARKPMPARKREKKAKMEERKGERGDVRAACVARSGGRCECGCGIPFGLGDYTPEWDEFNGRQHATIEESWMLLRCHHRAKTENYPTRRAWDSKFRAHCDRHGYVFRDRLIHEPVATKGTP